MGYEDRGQRRSPADSLKGAQRHALQACASSWEGRDSVPRLGAYILVDIFPATEASADLYTGEERTRIQEVSFYLQDLVRECVGVRELG